MVILFDLNGTLIHQVRTEQSHIASTYAALAQHHWDISFESFEAAWQKVQIKNAEKWRMGYQLLLAEQLDAAKQSLREHKYRENIAAILEELQVNSSNRLIEEITWAFQDSWVGGLTMAKETPDILKELGSAGYQLGLVTNFQQPDIIPDILFQFGLNGLFETVVVSASEGYRKPHPDLFRRALDDLDVLSESHVVYVGDDPVDDLKGALFAGLIPILIESKMSKARSSNPVTRIDNLGELPPLLMTLEQEQNTKNASQHSLSKYRTGGVHESA